MVLKFRVNPHLVSLYMWQSYIFSDEWFEGYDRKLLNLCAEMRKMVHMTRLYKN